MIATIDVAVRSSDGDCQFSEALGCFDVLDCNCLVSRSSPGAEKKRESEHRLGDGDGRHKTVKLFTRQGFLFFHDS